MAESRNAPEAREIEHDPMETTDPNLRRMVEDAADKPSLPPEQAGDGDEKTQELRLHELAINMAELRDYVKRVTERSARQFGSAEACARCRVELGEIYREIRHAVGLLDQSRHGFASALRRLAKLEKELRPPEEQAAEAKKREGD